MAYNTGNSIGSTEPKDLSDNARNLDLLMLGGDPSYPDRMGVPRKSWVGMEAGFKASQALRESRFDFDQAGREDAFNLFMEKSGLELPVDYAGGLSVTRPTQVFRYAGELYRAKDASLPFTTTTWAADMAKFLATGDAVLRQDLSGPDGAKMVSLPTGSVAQEIELQTRARFSDVPYSASIRTPKYSVLSPVADGDGIQAFPSAVRLGGVDYVFFRSGLQHTGNDGKIKVTLVSQATGLPVGEYMILNPSYDVRDPCVATDHRGRATLVGGVMKVVIFHAGTSTGVYVYDYNPANPSGALINPVPVTGPFIAMKSDVKKFSDGSFCFVTYDATGLCYWVKTFDFLNFQYELIGLGNECAVAEEADGTPVVIARDSDRAGDRMSVYKRTSLGVWGVAFKIPYAMHAPTIKKLSKVRASDPSFNAGWMLLGRDSKGVVTQGLGDIGNVRLTALFSRDDSGRVITAFDMIQDVMGQPRVASTEIAYGDAFYSSAITCENGSEVVIYSYGPVGRSDQQIGTTYNYKILRLAAAFKGGQGLLIQDNRRMAPNLLANADFTSSRFWTVPAGTSIALGLLTVETTSSGYVEQKIALVQGKQYAVSFRAKRVSGEGNAQNIGFTLAVRDPANTQVSAVVQAGTSSDLADDFHIISGQPFRVATTGVYTVRVSSGTAEAGTITQIDWLYLGECNDLTEYVGADVTRVTTVGTASMAGSPPTVPGDFSVSQFAWNSSLGMVMDGNRPLPFLSPLEAQNSLKVLSAKDANGRPLLVRSLSINASYAFGINVELFPSDASAPPIAGPLSVVFEASYDRA